jgi:HAD superfamily hydrolase (TIGR01549 family)
MKSDFIFPEDIEAVVFDVYGTLAQIQDKRSPFKKLIDFASGQGIFERAFAVRLMSSEMGLEEAALALGVEVPTELMTELKSDLQAELDSITLYDDVIPALKSLRARGIRIGVCSNLAAPYAPPAKALLDGLLDDEAWSFIAGACKPNPFIYGYVCSGLRCHPSKLLMVGDTMEADVLGPRQVGIRSVHLARKGLSLSSDSISTLRALG